MAQPSILVPGYVSTSGHIWTASNLDSLGEYIPYLFAGHESRMLLTDLHSIYPDTASQQSMWVSDRSPSHLPDQGLCHYSEVPMEVSLVCTEAEEGLGAINQSASCLELVLLA